MTQSERQIQDKFRRDALSVMSNHAEAVSLRLDQTEQTVSMAASAIAAQGENIDKLIAAIGAQKESIDRLERAITIMVRENAAQREMAGGLIKLATMLVEQRAS